MDNEVSLHPWAFAFKFDIQCMQQAGFSVIIFIKGKKINFLENVACRVEVCAFCCEELGAARPPPWSILVFWAMTKAIVVDDVRRDYVRKVTCPQPLKRCPFSTYV